MARTFKAITSNLSEHAFETSGEILIVETTAAGPGSIGVIAVVQPGSSFDEIIVDALNEYYSG